jgi:hypothetical protein
MDAREPKRPDGVSPEEWVPLHKAAIGDVLACFEEFAPASGYDGGPFRYYRDMYGRAREFGGPAIEVMEWMADRVTLRRLRGGRTES